MNLFKYALLSAAACGVCGLAFGQTTAYTAPVGYTTQTLTTGFNLIGLTLQTPVLVSGDFETVVGTVLTDSDVDFGTTLSASRTFILEVTSGTAIGVVQEFITFSGNTITVPVSITGLAADNTYRIRVAPTLEETFGTTLQSQATAAGSDIVWVPNGIGVFERYYRNTPFFGSPVWKKINANNTEVNAPNTPLVYLDAMFIEVKTTGKNLTVSGEVRTYVTEILVGTGFNATGTVFPVGATLGSSGLSAELQTQATAAGSDIIWIPSGAGAFTKYYYQTPFFGTATWRRINANNTETTVDGSTIDLASGVFIERKGGLKSMTLNPPAYGSL